MRIVLDCNVLVSSALTADSSPAQALELAITRAKIISSTNVIAELKTTLNKPKLEKYLRTKDKLSFIRRIETHSKIINVNKSVKVCRDPKDDMYLELALSGKADFIITGDSDLLDLHPFRGVDIITPKEFIDRLN